MSPFGAIQDLPNLNEAVIVIAFLKCDIDWALEVRSPRGDGRNGNFSLLITHF